MLKALWASIQCGRHHGKGNKFKDDGDLQKAIVHFLAALPYAEKTGNKGTVAFEMECIAITYQLLRQPSDAMKYAEKSLNLYRTLAAQFDKDFFAEAALRVEQLMSEIQT
jgi:hypothetical protein